MTTASRGIPTFKLFDDALLPLIEARERPASLGAGLPEVPRRWTEEDADVSVFKTEAKQAATRPDVPPEAGVGEERRQARRKRREQTSDWVKVALSDLVEGRDNLAAYGVNQYLPRCIAKLDALVRMRGE